MIPLDADRLAAFVAVAQDRGFSKAARSLGKTQSAVSQAVIHLEREVGHALFVREGRAVRLTRAGDLLLEHAARILAEMERARDRLAALGELREGRLVIGATDTLAYYLLPPVLASFREKYPGVELRLDNRPSPATALAVAEGRVDVGVVVAPLPPVVDERGRPIEARVHVTRIAAYDEVVVCPPRHPLATRRRVVVKDLAREPLVLLDRTTGTRAHLDALLEASNIQPRIVMEMSSIEVVKRLVELGFGVSVVPRMSLTRELAQGTLACVPLSRGAHGRFVGLVMPRGPSSPAASAFFETARGALRAG